MTDGVSTQDPIAEAGFDVPAATYIRHLRVYERIRSNLPDFRNDDFGNRQTYARAGMGSADDLIDLERKLTRLLIGDLVTNTVFAGGLLVERFRDDQEAQALFPHTGTEHSERIEAYRQLTTFRRTPEQSVLLLHVAENAYDVFDPMLGSEHQEEYDAWIGAYMGTFREIQLKYPELAHLVARPSQQQPYSGFGAF